MMTFVPFGLPVRTGRGPACAAISSHDRIALMTRADPPARPNCSRKLRRVRGKVPPRAESFDVMTPPSISRGAPPRSTPLAHGAPAPHAARGFRVSVALPTHPDLELHRARVPADRCELSEGRRSQ